MIDVIVIGGGASGLLAAGRLASAGAKVVLLEKNDMAGIFAKVRFLVPPDYSYI